MNITTTNRSGIRPEIPADLLIVGYIGLCGEVRAWQAALRLKWLLNSETSTQTTEEELIERATREKFKTL